MSLSAEEMNEMLNGATLVRELTFSTEFSTGECRMLLELAQTKDWRRSIRLQAQGVSSFELRGLGGGISQLCCLRVKDVRALQHDRIAFELEDLEDRRLFLRCRTLTVDHAGPSSG